MPPNQYQLLNAASDFQSARRKAAVQEILARITGKPADLLSYEEVAEKLRLRIRAERGLQHIPLDAIVGSLGRYTEFTRSFLPRRDDDQERWSFVKASMDDGSGLPPIEVYKVGEAYFVVDGNHRVSIARQEGFKSIDARVIEFQTPIPLSPDVKPDDLIIKAEYAGFLDATRLADLRPNVDLSVTAPGQYGKLIEQIRVQEYLLERERKGEVPFHDAAEEWYDSIYIPLAEIIRDRGLLRWFPNRTITDLYVWISENRAALAEELGWEIQSDVAATDLILKKSIRSEPGSWRKSRTAQRYTDHLFMDVLVPLSGEAESWDALDQALIIAEREGAKVHGLHIVGSSQETQGASALAIQARFNQTCAEANVLGNLVIESGDIKKVILKRATAADLIVLKIVHPPRGGLSTLRSPFSAILKETPRPILGVPAAATQLGRALLAYDGSPRAREALFVATYLAEVWRSELIVFTAAEAGKRVEDVQDFVRRYLDIHEVRADYVISENSPREQLSRTIAERNVDLVLMGSHGSSKLQQALIGSELDYMLRTSKAPIFICR